ncbi:HlyD family secretion protein [Haloferula sp. BvORR071]|uniref:HlyD family secretion protein n=1 Tax=Haloferula sp. BvORR071 TaxID=1396141 RepID=UPI000557D586|nr:HlyD family secretion protein [Haloferula sp. BvORR071]
MDILLLGIYAFFVWLIFIKLKWLPWNITSQVIVVTIPIIALTTLILLLNIFAPSSSDVRAMNYVIPIVPRVTGQVTEVPIEPNRPIKKGDVLFKMDPEPFEAAVKLAESNLEEAKVALVTAEAGQRGLEFELKNAQAQKAALVAQMELSQKRVNQFTTLAGAGAGRGADLESAQAQLASYQSQIVGAEAVESQVKQKLGALTATGELDTVAKAKTKIAQSEAALRSAKYDLEGCVHTAPADGRVANLALRPGVRATQFATMPVMSFIEDKDQWLLAFFRQNELRYVEPGNEAEIFLETYPGKIIKCKVDSILWATAQGQMPINGNLPNTLPVSMPEQRIAVRLLVNPEDKELFLAAGARGAGAIFTEHGTFTHILRKVFLRVSTKTDWFVLKLH